MLGSAEVFSSKSVGAEDGPTNTGSVGTGEGIPSEINEDADDGDTVVTNTVVAGVTLEKEDKTDVRSPTALIPLSPEGAGVEKGGDSVKMGVV